jgi:hypothetical protein
MAIATVNPATGTTEREFEAHTEQEVDARIGEAHDAFVALRGSTFAERSNWMQRPPTCSTTTPRSWRTWLAVHRFRTRTVKHRHAVSGSERRCVPWTTVRGRSAASRIATGFRTDTLDGSSVLFQFASGGCVDDAGQQWPQGVLGDGSGFEYLSGLRAVV